MHDVHGRLGANVPRGTRVALLPCLGRSDAPSRGRHRRPVPRLVAPRRADPALLRLRRVRCRWPGASPAEPGARPAVGRRSWPALFHVELLIGRVRPLAPVLAQVGRRSGPLGARLRWLLVPPVPPWWGREVVRPSAGHQTATVVQRAGRSIVGRPRCPRVPRGTPGRTATTSPGQVREPRDAGQGARGCWSRHSPRSVWGRHGSGRTPSGFSRGVDRRWPVGGVRVFHVELPGVPQPRRLGRSGILVARWAAARMAAGPASGLRGGSGEVMESGRAASGHSCGIVRSSGVRGIRAHNVGPPSGRNHTAPPGQESRDAGQRVRLLVPPLPPWWVLGMSWGSSQSPGRRLGCGASIIGRWLCPRCSTWNSCRAPRLGSASLAEVRQPLALGGESRVSLAPDPASRFWWLGITKVDCPRAAPHRMRRPMQSCLGARVPTATWAANRLHPAAQRPGSRGRAKVGGA